MVHQVQLEALLDYLEGNPELALGHFSKTKEGRSLSKRHWVDCANILNALSPNCPVKTAEEWRTFYNELKFKTLKKIKLQKAEQSATGGGVAKKNTLSSCQERLYNILGRDVGDPLPGVRHNLLHQNEVSECLLNPSPDGTDPINPNYVIMDYEVTKEDQVVSSQPEPPTPQDAPGGSGEPVEPRRRRRHTRRQQTQDADNAQLEAAQNRLERIEMKHAEATLEQARATNRLAAAIERAIDRLSEPFIIVMKNSPSPKKKRRRIISSEDDSD